MYHVVIIDDEPIIVEGISKLVPWEKYRCMVTACAYNGKEGLTTIREKEAIRLGVCRFLLKPSRLEEIEEALAAMVEILKKKGVASHEDDQEESTAGSFIVKNALAYMEEHYNEKLTLGLVAEKTYVSQWHLSKLLNKHENRNFSEILNQIRVEHAKELLKEMQLRIVDISEMVGFTDVAHFSRIFKKLEGISANESRNTKL